MALSMFTPGAWRLNSLGLLCLREATDLPRPLCIFGQIKEIHVFDVNV